MKSMRFLAAILLLSCATGRLLNAQRTIPTLAKTSEINGFEMYYEVYGKGDPLLLLHGFFGTGHESWGGVLDDLAEEHLLIIPDLRGHGRSTNPLETFTHSQAADDVLSLLNHLQLDRINAIGMSSGGNILLQVAKKQPNRLRSMILVSSAHNVKDQATGLIVDTTVETLGGYARLQRIHLRGKKQIDKLVKQFQDYGRSDSDMNLTADDLRKIGAKTMIVFGDRDRYMPISIAFEQYSCIPNSRLWVIPNSDHVPIFDFSKSPYGKLENVPFVARALDFLRD